MDRGWYFSLFSLWNAIFKLSNNLLGIISYIYVQVLFCVVCYFIFFTFCVCICAPSLLFLFERGQYKS